LRRSCRVRIEGGEEMRVRERGIRVGRERGWVECEVEISLFLLYSRKERPFKERGAKIPLVQ
jgi:hypothetical protein